MTTTTEAPNTGHGHVRPRPDGVRARCGGPAVCRVCQQERAAIDALAQQPSAPSAEPAAWNLLAAGLAGLAGWWALVMGAAASIEEAANCLRDPDAKRQAEGAAKHYREAAKAMWAKGATPQAAPVPTVQPLTEAQAKELMAGLNRNLTGFCGWGWLDVIRETERACAAAWNVKLAGIPAAAQPTKE